MANRFDTVQQDQYRYTPQYIPLPLEAITNMAKDHSDKNRNALAEINREKSLLAIKADPRNEAYRDKLLGEMTKQVNYAAEKIAKEGYTPENEYLWTKTKNAITTNPDRLRLEQQWKEYNEKYLPDLQKLSSDKKYMPELDDYHGSGSPDKLTPWHYKGLEGRLDWREAAVKAVGDIKDSGMSKEWFERAEDGSILGIKKDYKGVSEQKFTDLIKDKTGVFLKTTEGQQYAEVLHRQNPQAEWKDIYAAIEKFVYDANSNKIGIVTDTDKNLSWMPGYARQEANANKTTTLQSEAISDDNYQDFTKDLKFDSKGNLEVPTKSVMAKDLSERDRSVYGVNQVGETSVPVKDLKKMSEQVAYIKSLQDEHPDLRGLTPKATVDAYTKARKAVRTESIPLNTMSNDAARSIGASLARNLEARTLYLMDGKGVTKPLTLDVVSKMVDMKPEEIKKQMTDQGLGGYTQHGQTPGSYFIQVKDGRRIMISADAEIGDSFRDSFTINQARKDLVSREVPSRLPGSTFLIHPKISKTGDVSWDYYRIKKDLKGNVIKKEPLDYDALVKFEQDMFKESGYLGSQLTIKGDQEAF